MKLLKLFVLFTLIAYNVSAQLIYRKGTASGTDTYTVTVTPTFTAYYEDQRFLIEFTNANTGASTININSKGAISLVKEGGTELEADDIKAGEIKFLVYDGTNMQVVGGGGGAAVTASNGLTKTLDDIQLGGVMANTTQITGADGLLFQFILGDGSPSSTRFNLSNSQTQWTFSNATGNRFIRNSSTGLIIEDGISGKGVEYSADYSATFTNRSLVDKDYADTKLPKSSTASTGTDVVFDIPRTYGYAADATGNITFTTTGLVEGITQLMIHNDSSEPTFESGMVIISGTYVTGVDNYIMMHAVKSNLILVTISQEQ